MGSVDAKIGASDKDLPVLIAGSKVDSTESGESRKIVPEFFRLDFVNKSDFYNKNVPNVSGFKGQVKSFFHDIEELKNPER